MHEKPRRILPWMLVFCALALCSCGKKADLYLPEDAPEKGKIPVLKKKG